MKNKKYIKGNSIPALAHKTYWVVILTFLFATAAFSEDNSKTSRAAGPAQRLCQVDKQGVLRWQDNGQEVALFGVNYCLPSACAYRMVGRVGASYEQTIDQDVCHFARMSLDAIRLHFWGDWECSDSEGNLIDNEHLRLLDYLIYKAKERGIYMLLTPIAVYDSRWPDAFDTPIDGFSKVYGKGRDSRMGTDPNGIKVQANYLSQILRHVNRYTNLAYKDEPAILAIELVNEPYLPPAVTEYINTLAKAVRDTSCSKPIFFNVSQHKETAADVGNSIADGATFGWYPTDLLAGRSLRGNFLTHVEDYPLMSDPALATKAKVVYEFDAADIPNSYMYPAMARTFRSGSAQFAAMFTYDPLPIAFNNIEFQTHYLNLVYTPNKAVSFIIACQAFHNLPRLKSYGKYPENTRFGPFRVSYEQNLSEMVTERQFMYSNNTRTNPPRPQSLEQIAGCGSSPVVFYEGTGSYFLDKLQAGVWRLEVYPDAVWVNDPYGRHRFDREVSRVLWHNWPMEINLPDLSRTFTVEPINKDNKFNTETKNGIFTIHPGVYLLKRNDVNALAFQASTPFGHLSLGEFVAPPEKELPMAVLHEPVPETAAGREFVVTATVCNSRLPDAVTLYVWRAPHREFSQHQMQRQKGYVFTAKVPAEKVKAGLFKYCITVQYGEKVYAFPADVQGRPADWDFPAENLWETLVVEANAPIVLYDVSRDRNKLLFSQYWGGVPYTYDFVEGMNTGKLALRFEVPSLKDDPQDVSCRYIFGREADGRLEDMGRFQTLCLRVRAGQIATTHFGVTLMEKDGSNWAATVPITEQWKEICIPLSQFVSTKAAMLPRGWGANPYWLGTPTNRGGKEDHLHIENVESIQFSIGARFLTNYIDGPHAIELESVTLGKPR